METLQLHLHVGTVDLGPYWLAFEQQLGIAVFAPSEDEAESRLGEAVDFALENIDDGTLEGRELLFEYLNKHGVSYDSQSSADTPVFNAISISDLSWEPVPHEASLANVS